MASSLKLITRLSSLLVLLGLSNALWASMIVQQSIVYFQPGDPSRQDIKITNPDSEPLYIQVELREIINAGMDNETSKTVTNPKEAGLLITPNRLAIQPGSQQALRMINIKGLGDAERVFRVALKPVAADVEATETGVKVLIGYELLVLIQPATPKIQISHVREGNKMTLVNEGNTNVLFSRGEQCKDDKKTECTELNVFRLYPGNKVVVDLKYGDKPVSYLSTSGTLNQTVVY